MVLLMDTPTKYYQFDLPEDEDLMSLPQLGITDNFEKILKASNCDIVSDTGELPNTGYHVGDKIYAGGAALSIYVCIAEDPYWGNWWKPIHAPATPFQSVPAAAIEHPDWEIHPTYPFKIMIDNRGRLWGRGAIHLKAGSPDWSDGVSYSIVRTLPDGIRPPSNTMIPTVINAVAMTNPAGVTALKTGRWFIRSDGTNSHRMFNGAAGTSDTWHTEMRYQTGRNDFTTP